MAGINPCNPNKFMEIEIKGISAFVGRKKMFSKSLPCQSSIKQSRNVTLLGNLFIKATTTKATNVFERELHSH